MRKFWFAAIIGVPVMLVTTRNCLVLPQSLHANGCRRVWSGGFSSLSGVATLPVMFWATVPGRGMAAFKHHAADMNTLIALGTNAAWIYSHGGDLLPHALPENTATPFYDVTAVVTALVVLGQGAGN